MWVKDSLLKKKSSPLREVSEIFKEPTRGAETFTGNLASTPMLKALSSWGSSCSMHQKRLYETCTMSLLEWSPKPERLGVKANSGYGGFSVWAGVGVRKETAFKGSLAVGHSLCQKECQRRDEV